MDELTTVLVTQVAFTSIMAVPCTSLKDALHVDSKETYSTSGTYNFFFKLLAFISVL